MNHITSRRYEGEKDFHSMVDLIVRARPPEYRNDYPVRVDLEENLASATVCAKTRLWFDDLRPIGWALVDDYNNLLWELEQQYESVLGSQLVDWAEACLRRGLAAGESAALDTNCREDYTARIVFLERHGFQRTGSANVAMVRLLSEPIPEPELPPGFLIRPLAGSSELEAVAAMHRAAFGTEYMTAENRLVIMSTAEYDAALDLVAIAPDGAIAANCICSANEQEKIGRTDPVATHPQYQHMGLARALLLTGLRLLKERGMLTARLGTSGDNLAMQKAAASAGFGLEYRTLWFSKQVCQSLL